MSEPNGEPNGNGEIPPIFTMEWWVYLDEAVDKGADQTGRTTEEVFYRMMQWILGAKERLEALLETGDLEPALEGIYR